jgi:hypothetical protein
VHCAAAVSAKKPEGHGTHEICPAAAEEPARHAMQGTLPDAALAKPAVHSLHAPCKGGQAEGGYTGTWNASRNKLCNDSSISRRTRGSPRATSAMATVPAAVLSSAFMHVYRSGSVQKGDMVKSYSS